MIQIEAHDRLGEFGIDMRLSVPDIGVTALFGPSGSGKTSLLNMIGGLRSPQAGRITVGDKTLFDSEHGIDVPPERRRIGYIFQEGRLFPHLTVRRNLTYGMRRTPAAERYIEADQVISLLGIEPLLDRRPARLSGGEKQRVAIGRALLASPRMLLMDEPLAALDAARKAEILPFIERLHSEITIPIIYVSHAMDEVLRIADTVAVVRDGGIEAVGPVEELASRLDLAGQAGFGEAGTVLAATVARHDDGHALTELETPAGKIMVGRLDAPVGARTRLRLRARDIALALQAPRQASFLNVLQGTVTEMERRESGAIEVAVGVGPNVRIWSEVTQLAVERLGLTENTPVHVLIKSVAVERYVR